MKFLIGILGYPMNKNEKKQDLIKPFHDVWHLKLNDPIARRALWLRFSRLCTTNGFKKTAENWAVYYHRGTHNQEVKKVAVKQTLDLSAYLPHSEFEPAEAFEIGECFFSEHRTQGIINSKGNSIEWDLTILPGPRSTFSPVPEILKRTGLVKNSVTTLQEQLWVSGKTIVNGETIEWKEALGMAGYRSGSKSGFSWTWGHCNAFSNEQGEPSDFIFEGLTARVKLGPVVSPPFSAFFFHYQGKPYFFNTVMGLFHLKSKSSLNEWQFEASRGDLAFRGHMKAEHKYFACLTYEDTNGSLLYCASSKLSDMRILVYRNGKLESTLVAQGTAAFEVTSRQKNPYVPILI